VSSLDKLVEAVAVLTDEARVLELALLSLLEACPRGVAFGGTSRGVSAQRPGRFMVARDAAARALEIPPLAYVRTPAIDLANVPLDQRNRWIEPFRDGIATRDGFKRSTIYPFVRHLGILDQGRVAICAGPRCVAFVGLGVPEGTEFDDAERARLVEASNALVGPLRIASMVVEASGDRSALERLLDSSDDAVIAIDATGAVVDTSRPAFELLRRDRSLPDRLREIAKRGTGRPFVVHGDRDVVHVTPCGDNARVAFLAVVDGAGFVEPPVALTERQRELLALLERGLTNASIGDAMSIAPSTVKTMLERLYERASVANRVELLAWWRALPR
jgi:DNA-binding CsgD family transcriptional regulator